MVRQKIVAPYLDDVITEQSLGEDPQGLKGLLQRVTKIVPKKLELLVIHFIFLSVLLFLSPFYLNYSNHLKTGLVRYSDGQKLSSLQMVRYSNGV